MWTRVVKSERILGSLALQRPDRTILHSRAISTNSAIHRGIRKSRTNPASDRRSGTPTRPDLAPRKFKYQHQNLQRKPEPPPNKFKVQYQKLQRQLKKSEPARPNHAGRQDLEDIKISTELARKRVNEKLERYKRGGRPKPNLLAGAPNSDRRYSKTGYKETPRFARNATDRRKGVQRDAVYDVNGQKALEYAVHQGPRERDVTPNDDRRRGRDDYGEKPRSSRDVVDGRTRVRPGSLYNENGREMTSYVASPSQRPRDVVPNDDRENSKGGDGEKPGFLRDIIEGRTGVRYGTIYDKDRPDLPDDLANQGHKRRGLVAHDVSGTKQYDHGAYEGTKSSMRANSGSTKSESEMDRRSEARTSYSRQSREGTADDSFQRGQARGRENGSGGDFHPPYGATRRSGRTAHQPEDRPMGESRLRYQHAADIAPKGRIPGEAPAPLSIPYTTPASEFLYGTSVVMAALKADRRQFYKLYVYAGENRLVENQDEEMKRLARKRRVEFVKVSNDWLRLLDKMSSGRPHNGYVLEASPLPKHPATSLRPVEGHNKTLAITLDHQTKEDIAVNGRDPVIKYRTSFPRYPFLLMLDGILDPGNFGAIFRSAHFLGADGIIYSQRNCAPLSSIALKASAGASEFIPLIPVSHPPAFIVSAQTRGWKFYAAAASQHKAVGRQQIVTTSDIGCPTRDHPCVVMLGSEGEGLRLNLLSKADYLLAIEGQRMDLGGIDSLNVSVAAALVCEAMLRRPTTGVDSKGGKRATVEDEKVVDDERSDSSIGNELF